MPKSTRLIISSNETRTEIGGRKWMDASANELVQAARGKFLPLRAVPYRLVRDGQKVAFFNPFAPLREANPQHGDVLETVVDTGQAIESPSFLYVLRELEAAKVKIVQSAETLHRSGQP